MGLVESRQVITSKYIQQELTKACVFERLCNRNYEGEIEYGKTVKILNVLRPTISAHVTRTGFGDPEDIQDSGQFLIIDKQYDFNFVDHEGEKKQHRPETVKSALKQASEGMAEQRDSDIATAAAAGAGTKTTSAEIDAESEWEAAFWAGDEQLKENNVKPNAKKFMIIKPWVEKYLRGLLIADKTQNDELIATGRIGRYLDYEVILSNALYNDGTDDYILMGTYDSIAFAAQVETTRIYSTHDKYIGTVYQGLDTYGIKVTKPKELYAILAHE